MPIDSVMLGMRGYVLKSQVACWKVAATPGLMALWGGGGGLANHKDSPPINMCFGGT